MEAFYFMLRAFFEVAPFVVAVLLALGVGLFCVMSYDRVAVGVGGAVAVYVLMQIFPNLGIHLGLYLSLFDLYFLPLALVVGVRILGGHLELRDNITRVWVLLVVVWGALFAVGLVQYKTAAGVEFRSTFYTAVCVLYLLSQRLTAEHVGRVFGVLYAGTLTLVVVAVYRWICVAVGEYGHWYDPTTPLRVLNSGASMVVALAMLPGLAMWMKLNTTRTAMMMLAPLLMLAVMVLGHRSVWVAAFAALGFAWWLAGRRRRGGQAGLLVPLAIGTLTLGLLFVLAPRSTVTQEFQRSVAETQSKTSTLAWRVDSWKSLLDDWVASGPAVWPAGKPFGASKRRYIESQGMESEVGAHSHYVSLLIRGGLLGVFAFLAASFLSLRRLTSRPVATPDWLGGELLAVFLVGYLVYGLAYSAEYMHALFVGLAFTLATRAPSTVAADSTAAPTLAVVPDVGWQRLKTR